MDIDNLYSTLSQKAAEKNYSFGVPRYNRNTNPGDSEFLNLQPTNSPSAEIVPLGTACSDNYKPDLSFLD